MSGLMGNELQVYIPEYFDPEEYKLTVNGTEIPINSKDSDVELSHGWNGIKLSAISFTDPGDMCENDE